MEREHDLDAPRGVAGRNSDNTFIKEVLGWEPNTPLRDGIDIRSTAQISSFDRQQLKVFRVLLTQLRDSTRRVLTALLPVERW